MEEPKIEEIIDDGLVAKLTDDLGTADDEPVITDFTPVQAEIEENYDDVEDESLYERLWGLTEMFPEPLRNGVWSAGKMSVSGVKKAYKFSRSSLWVVGTSFVVLGLPVIFEVERVQAEEAALMQQRQILLGPGGGSGGQQPLNLQPQRR